MQVAPVYTNAWEKTWYEGQAVLVIAPHWSYSKTLLGVTCTLYLVKFFYTEINLERWIDDADIDTWTDLEQHSLSIAAAFPSTYITNYATELKWERAASTSLILSTYIPLPTYSAEDEIHSISLYFAFTNNVDVGSYVRFELRAMDSLTPAAAPTLYVGAQGPTQPPQYIKLEKIFDPVLSFTPHTQLSLRIVTSLVASGAGAAQAYVKTPTVFIVRKI